MNYKYLKYSIFSYITILFMGCSSTQGAFVLTDIGKDYQFPKDKHLDGLYHHIAKDDDVIGGNTSIRNIDPPNLKWKGDPKGNGFGYFQRNRDLGQVFTVSKKFDVRLDALVLRTSRGNKAIMEGTSKAEMYVVFFEVKFKKDKKVKINDNGTTKGDKAKHGFDHQFNRADDYIEGVQYIPIHQSTGGVFPETSPTTQYVYEHKEGHPFGEQEGHLRYYKFDFLKNSELYLEGGKTYAFIVGFTEPGNARGLALAIDSEVHTKEAAAFVLDSNGNIRWGIRREGNGLLPPTMIEIKDKPTDNSLSQKLITESVFPKNHYLTLSPTSDGYPDVDTYRTLQFYLELKEVISKP